MYALKQDAVLRVIIYICQLQLWLQMFIHELKQSEYWSEAHLLYLLWINSQVNMRIIFLENLNKFQRINI
ncbi:hypothetical protein pb186bvf_002283 [Paramecium bursaria]